MGEIVEHKFMTRKRGKFVDDIHTNRIESFWSLYKRTLNGTYHHYSEEQIDKFLAETSFRYNCRHFNKEEVFKYFIKCCLFKPQ